MNSNIECRCINEHEYAFLDIETGECLFILNVTKLNYELIPNQKTVNNIEDTHKKVFLMLDGEPLDRRSIILVETEEQAEKLCKYHSRFEYYEEIKIMSEKDVYDNILDDLWSELGEEKAEEKIKKIFPNF